MVIIQRLESSDQGTFGRLEVRGYTFYTGELPWRDNKPDFSCIPKGSYHCSWTFSKHFGRYMYHLADVPNRSGIRFHSGNYVGDSTRQYRAQSYGCILLGEKVGVLDGQRAVLVSRPAISKFESLLERRPFLLEIK